MQSRSDLGSRPEGPTSTGPTSAARTATLESGTGDASPRGAFQRTATRLAGLVLLVAVAVGLLGQGAYYPSVQHPVGLLLAAAAVLALAAWPPTRGDARFLLVPTLALAAWAVGHCPDARASRPGSQSLPDSGGVNGRVLPGQAQGRWHQVTVGRMLEREGSHDAETVRTSGWYRPPPNPRGLR